MAKANCINFIWFTIFVVNKGNLLQLNQNYVIVLKILEKHGSINENNSFLNRV